MTFNYTLVVRDGRTKSGTVDQLTQRGAARVVASRAWEDLLDVDMIVVSHHDDNTGRITATLYRWIAPEERDHPDHDGLNMQRSETFDAHDQLMKTLDGGTK